jgi:fucose 4-O-acetylase-like acetyltransferase
VGSLRLHWIDALKGFGIILVVFGHYVLPIALDTYIFSFHMPLFFFISGFLFNFPKYAESTANFVKGRLFSIIVPYFGFAVLTCLLYFLLDEIFSPGVVGIKFFEGDILYIIYSILYATTSKISYNTPLWFLTCLFVTEMLFYWLSKRYYWQPQKLVICLFAAGVIGYLYPVVVPFRLFWNVDIALTAVVFYGAGNLFRKFVEMREGLKVGFDIPKLGLRSNKTLYRAEKFLPSIFIFGSLLYFAYLLEFPTDRINMSDMYYGGLFSFYFLAFLGIFTYIYIFKKVGSLNVLEYYGRNSLIVLALHYVIRDALLKLSVILFGIHLDHLDGFVYTTSIALILTVLNLIGLIPIINIINRYFPLLAGKRTSIEDFESIKVHFRRSPD